MPDNDDNDRDDDTSDPAAQVNRALQKVTRAKAILDSLQKGGVVPGPPVIPTLNTIAATSNALAVVAGQLAKSGG